MKTPRILLMALLLATLIGNGLAFADKVKNEPGYVDLDWIEIPDTANEVQDIDLTTILKSVASDAKGSGDEELAQVLEMIRSIRVKGFSVDEEYSAATEKTVKKITSQLKDSGWKRLIYVKSDEEMVSVNTKYTGDDLVGLMVVVYEPGEEVMFANVVGDLDLPTLMKLVGAMDGEGLEDLLEELDDIDGIDIHVDDDHDHD